MKHLIKSFWTLLSWLLALCGVAGGLIASGFLLGCFYGCARIGWTVALRLLNF